MGLRLGVSKSMCSNKPGKEDDNVAGVTTLFCALAQSIEWAGIIIHGRGKNNQIWIGGCLPRSRYLDKTGHFGA